MTLWVYSMMGADDRKEDIGFYKTSKSDLFFIIPLLIFSIASILWIAQNRNQQLCQPRKAFLYHNNKVLKEIDLGKNTVFGILNGKMRVEVKEGRLRIANSDCPQHICRHMGWIQYSGQTIVCVPNHVLIEIKSATPQVLDAVVY